MKKLRSHWFVAGLPLGALASTVVLAQQADTGAGEGAGFLQEVVVIIVAAGNERQRQQDDGGYQV